MMSRFEKVCIEQFGATALEARNIEPRAVAFADMLKRLTKHYSVANYDLSWDIKQRLNDFPRQPNGTLQQLKHKATLLRIKSKISSDMKAMWETAMTALKLEQELFYALEVYQLDVAPAHYITTLLEALSEAGKLSNPKAVADGREIFENIAFHPGLTETLGFQPPFHELIPSAYYHHHTRKAFR